MIQTSEWKNVFVIMIGILYLMANFNFIHEQLENNLFRQKSNFFFSSLFVLWVSSQVTQWIFIFHHTRWQNIKLPGIFPVNIIEFS